MEFDAMIRTSRLIRATEIAGEGPRQLPFDVAVLTHDERHVRRKVITLAHGDRVLVDFAETLVLEDRDVLVLEDGRHAEIIAAEEELLAVCGRDGVHLARLAWHIGNRHLAAEIDAERILILRDHVIKSMLEGLGATVSEVLEPFSPLRGAYSGEAGHDHAPVGHSHGHHHDHGHAHEHDDHRDVSGQHSHEHSAPHGSHRHDE
jgi:urease accessory protein